MDTAQIIEALKNDLAGVREDLALMEAGLLTISSNDVDVTPARIEKFYRIADNLERLIAAYERDDA